MRIRPEDWARIKAVLEQAMELPGDARTAYVADVCGDDVEMRGHVDRLLASHDRATTFLEHSAFITIDPPIQDLEGRLIASYRIEARLGIGGMGEVYRAHDMKLDRTVALKLLPPYVAADARRVRESRAEARAASSLNHPNILVVHDFGVADERPFIVTEYVEGETLRQRLLRGTVPLRELLGLAVQIASALAAAHHRGVLHLDIKPENVMVRSDGYVKVLDFGLARLIVRDKSATASESGTREGLLAGTPQYMSPEQARAEHLDFRSDQFSFGALLYELATGRSPFARSSAIESAAAVITDQPEALSRARPEMPLAFGRIVERCLAKNRADRYGSTSDVHRELVAIQEHRTEIGVAEPLRRMTANDALAILPLKILRGRSDADFLAFSLPDAIAASLAERATVPVRSPLAAGRHGGADADLGTLAEAMGCRFALTGTLACLEERLALRLQLLAIPAGTVLWSDSRVTTLQELFELQDTVAAHVARALPASLGGISSRANGERDIPKSPGAYAFYLRANQLAYEVSHWHEARDLYHACLEADPEYAPAWARVARCERLIGKFSTSSDEARACLDRAEAAFQRATSLNPDLSITHRLYAQLMVDIGRPDDAMQRLLGQLRVHPRDPELYAGLVHALRFCGLLDASVAAHARARTLDPTVPTSIHHTWWMKGEYERALSDTFGDIGYMQGLALASLGREKEAIAALRWRERETAVSRIRPYLTSLRALLEGDREKSLSALETASALQFDAEALYYLVRTFARIGEVDRAASEFRRVIEGGFWCHETLVRDPWLDTIRGRGDVGDLLQRARDHTHQARRMFGEAGGPELITEPLPAAV